MRKRILITAAVIVFAAIFVKSFSANDLNFTDQSQIADHLAGQRPSFLELSCSGDLYDTLQRNNFKELYRMLARAGINYNQAEISFSSLLHFISLRNLQYRDLPRADCFSMDDVRRSVRELAPMHSDILLLCTDELFARLLEGNDLYRIAAQNGIESFLFSYNSGLSVLEMQEPKYFTVPYAAVNDRESFSKAVTGFADQGLDEFVIIFEPDLFTAVTGDPEGMSFLTEAGKLDTYKASYSETSCTFHFTDVTFTDNRRETCGSAEDLVLLIRRMGREGTGSFEVFFPEKAVFEYLTANDFAALYVIDPDSRILTTAAEASEYAETMLTARRKDIHLFCTPELYSFLGGDASRGAGSDPMLRIYDLITHAGIFDYEITTTNSTRLISVHILKLFPGKDIILALRRGETGSLSPREFQTLQAASAIAAASGTTDPLLTAKNIHDRICENTVYAVNEASDEDDTAIGAILNGQANCDGYSDAFYLIGSLAGLNIRYQRGMSLDKTAPDTLESVAHIWNLLETGGVWHMVDATWDDDADGMTDIWFNAGRDIASRMHVWNEDMTVRIAETSDHRLSRDFYAQREQDLWNAVDSARAQGRSGFYILFEDPSLSVYLEDVKNYVGEKTSGGYITWSWNEQMSLLGFHDLDWR